jgi:hypothetical protein
VESASCGRSAAFLREVGDQREFRSAKAGASVSGGPRLREIGGQECALGPDPAGG